MNKKTILVTGGAGFIGGNFVLRYLAQQTDCRLINLDALTYAGNLDTLRTVESDSRYRFCHGDIGDSELTGAVFEQERPIAVLNFAAESHVDRSIDGPAAFVETNVNGTLNLLQQALTYWRGLSSEEQSNFRFLHVSTDEVYGSLGPEGAFTEATPYAPNSPYAASKAASDHLVRAFHHTYGLPTLTTNCSNNYGPYQFPEKLIPLMILNALAGNSLPVYGDGQQVRDWLFVEDHVDAIYTVLTQGVPGEVYNIGGAAEKTNLEVVKLICQLLDTRQPLASGDARESLITHVTDRPGHDRRYAIDFTKLQQQTGWRPRIGFETGLARTVDWYLAHSAWVQRVQDGSYRGERLGLTGS